MSPWPGKCFPTGRIPRESDPFANAIPRAAAVRGSSEKARSPITGLRGLLSTSRTGAKFTSIPTARSSAAVAAPKASATDSLRQRKREQARAGGKRGERRILEPRHAASLLVDGDQREGIAAARGGSDLAAQGAHLGGALDVAGEEDDAADLPACEPSRQRGGERLPLEADPQGGGDGFRSISSSSGKSTSFPPARRGRPAARPRRS